MVELEFKFFNVNNVKFYLEVVNLGFWKLRKEVICFKEDRSEIY